MTDETKGAPADGELAGPIGRAALEVMARQSAQIALLTGLLVRAGIVTKEEAVLVAAAGSPAGPTPGPTPAEVALWIQGQLERGKVRPMPRRVP